MLALRALFRCDILVHDPTAVRAKANRGVIPAVIPVWTMCSFTPHLASDPFINEDPGYNMVIPLSIRRFIEDDKTDSWMFISLKQDQMDTLRPLISLWCDIAANGILSLPPSRERRIWIVLDEVASLQKLNALGSVLERGRKHGCAVVLGLQSMPQLRDIYGRDGAAALASQPQTWIVLRSVEPETAKWLESALGEYETEEFKESVALGGGNARTGVSISQQERKKSLIMAGEIQSLPDLVGYLKMPGDRPIYKIKLELKPDPT